MFFVVVVLIICEDTRIFYISKNVNYEDELSVAFFCANGHFDFLNI
jgi:hypothetical protein